LRTRPRDGARGRGNGARAAFRADPGVAGHPLQLDPQVVSAGGPQAGHVGGPAIPVEAQFGVTQLRHSNVPRAVEADLLLNGPEEGQRRVRQILLENLEQGRQQDRGAAAIIAPQRRAGIRRPHHARGQLRTRTDAQRNRVEVRHQQAPRPFARSRQADDQVAHVAPGGTLAMHIVDDHARSRQTCLLQLLDDVLLNPALLATLARYGHQAQHAFDGGGAIKLGKVGLRLRFVSRDHVSCLVVRCGNRWPFHRTAAARGSKRLARPPIVPS